MRADVSATSKNPIPAFVVPSDYIVIAARRPARTSQTRREIKWHANKRQTPHERDDAPEALHRTIHALHHAKHLLGQALRSSITSAGCNFVTASIRR